MTTDAQEEQAQSRLGLTFCEFTPAEIRRYLLLGHPLLIVLRNSGQSETNRNQAASDIKQVADGLTRHLGIDASPVLPTSDEILAALCGPDAWQVDSVDSKGRKFTNRFALIDRSDRGLIVLVSSGSVTKIERTTRTQPFLQVVTRLVNERLPSVLWVKLDDRLSRNGHAMSPLLLSINENREAGLVDTQMGNSDAGIEPRHALSDIMRMLKADQAGETSRLFLLRGREKMQEKTGETMVAGQVSFATGQAVPPGFARVMLSGIRGAQTPGLMYADCDASRPDSDAVAEHRPRVYDDDGRPVDQVSFIRFVLAHAGKPGWGRKELASAAILHRFSTDGMRRCSGTDKHCGNMPRAAALNAVDAILANLDLYETGRLTRSVGQRGVPDIVIEGCFPPDGLPWATPEDFARIREWAATERASRARPNYSKFGGLKVTANGRPAKLVRYYKLERELGQRDATVPASTRGRQPDGHSQVLYRVEYPEGRQLDAASGYVSHEALSLSIAEGIAAAGEVPLHRFQAATDDPIVASLAADVATAQRELELLRTEQSNRLGALVTLGGDPSGSAALKEIHDLYNENAPKAAAADEALGQARRALAARQARVQADAVTQRSGVQLTELFDFLKDLRDPAADELRTEWHRAVRDVSITVEHLSRSGLKGKRIRWEGVLLLTAPHDVAVKVPFHGEVLHGGMFSIDERTQSAVAALRDGVPHPLMRNHDAGRPELERFLGHNKAGYPILRVTSAPLLRLAMQVLHPADGNDADLQALSENPDMRAEYGRPELLAERLIAVDRERSSKPWLRRDDRAWLVECLVAAAGEGGLLPPRITYRSRDRLRQSRWATEFDHDDDGGMTLRPCAFCGGLRRAALGVTVAEGLVCLDCRHDPTGVKWPADPYDQWISSPALWSAVGWVPTVPAPFNPGIHEHLTRPSASGRPRGARTGTLEPGHRLATDLSVEEAQDAVARYVARVEPVAQIRESVGLPPHQWRRLLRAHGDPRRGAYQLVEELSADEVQKAIRRYQDRTATVADIRRSLRLQPAEWRRLLRAIG